MTRLKFDVTGVDPAGSFKVPARGAYKAKVDVVDGPKESSKGNDMLEIQYVITEDGEFTDSRVWDYIVLDEANEWKFRRFLEAVGAVTKRKEKGALDLDKVIGTPVLIKVTHEDSEEYGLKARIGNVTKAKGGDVDEDDEDLDEELDGDEGDLTYEDVMAMSKAEIKELIEEEELEIRLTKNSKVANLRKRVIDELELEEAEEEEEDEDEDDDGIDNSEVTAEDVEAMSKAELKELIEEEELEIRVTKASKVANLRKRVIEELELGEDEEEEEDEEDEEDEDEVEEVEDYGELPVGDLRNELKERGLPTKGTKPALVKRLEKDDDKNDPF